MMVMSEKKKTIPLYTLLVISFLMLTSCATDNINQVHFLTESDNNTYIGLSEYEFSAITTAWGNIYASGVEGLIEINPATLQMKFIDDLEMAFVKALLFDPNLDKLIIGYSKGLAYYDGTSVNKPAELQKFDQYGVNHLALNQDNNLVIATYDGLIITESDGTFQLMTNDDGLLDNMINQVLVDDDNTIWAANYIDRGGGVHRITNTEVDWTFTIEEGLAHNAITTIHRVDKDKILVGGGVFTAGGFSVFDRNQETWKHERNVTFEDGLIGEKVRHIQQDPDGNLWICSEYDGITIMDQDYQILGYLTIDQGLSHNEVKDIHFSTDGKVWMATRQGITHFDFSRLEDMLSSGN